MSTRVLVLGEDPELPLALVLQSLSDAGLEPVRVALTWSLQRPFPLRADSVDAELLQVFEFNGGRKGLDLHNRERHGKAWLATIERVLLIMPAQPTEWAVLGAVWAHRPLVRLAVLLHPAHQLQPDLPLMLQHASLVTTELERAVAWCQGRLFQSLLPPERGQKGPS